MPSTEESRKHRKRTRNKAHVSGSRISRPDHDAVATSHTLVPEGPATLEDLRKARLVYLETPPEERAKKMKYEYTRKVPVKTTTAVSEASSRQGSTRRKRRHKSSRQEKQVKTTDDGRRSKAVDDDEGFVYRTRAVVSERCQDEPDREPSKATTIKVERSPKSERQPSQRKRSTQDTKTPAIETKVKEYPSRPPLRKSNTVLSSPSRSSIHRNAVSDLGKGGNEPLPARALNPKTASSMFGGLFTRRAPPIPEVKLSCLTCGDDVVKSRTAKLPCGHHMCQSCLKRIFKLSVTDPAHMPPKCCTDQHIDLRHVDKLFNDDFKKNWNRKFKEYKAKNRIYCPKKGCGQWIQPKHIVNDKGRKTGKCPSCKTYVCGICNQKMHKSRDCPKDPATKQFVEIAKKEGWQKCYSCSATVELKEGCNHMTCRCTAEFCMVCGLKWKSCDCPWFSYEQVDVDGDPIRYQQELDRRQEQAHRDAELALRLEALDMDNAMNAFWRIGNRGANAPTQVNQNFFEQAREALTANYQVADQAARGLLHGFFPARANTINGHVPLPPPIPADDEAPAVSSRSRRRRPLDDPAETPTLMHTPLAMAPERRSTRRRAREPQHQFTEQEPIPVNARQLDQERRIRQWADGMPDLTG